MFVLEIESLCLQTVCTTESVHVVYDRFSS